MEGDPETHELELEQRDLERAEREQARAATEPPDQRTHERRAERHAYLREKLSERAKSEDEVAAQDEPG